LGHRWALDLAGDNYSLPGYFGGQRWDYYRLRTEGQNTLVLNPSDKPGQDPRAATKILRFVTQPNASFAVADLTPAYAPQATKVQRGVMLLGRKQVLIQDEIESAAPSDTWWFMHTPAEIKIEGDGSSAVLTQGKARMMAKILLPVGAQFSVMDAKPLPTSPDPQGQERKQRHAQALDSPAGRHEYSHRGSTGTIARKRVSAHANSGHSSAGTLVKTGTIK
jgi:hypothetical protein